MNSICCCIAVFNIEYQGGLAPISTTGEDFVDGATRTFNLSGPSGYYEIAETVIPPTIVICIFTAMSLLILEPRFVRPQLVSYTNSSDGSFVQVNEQSSSKSSLKPNQAYFDRARQPPPSVSPVSAPAACIRSRTKYLFIAQTY